jgi:hypothetical protein
LEFNTGRNDVDVLGAVTLLVKYGIVGVLVRLKPRKRYPLELVKHFADLLIGGLIVLVPRNDGGSVCVLELQRLGDGCHLIGIAPKHLNICPHFAFVIVFTE